MRWKITFCICVLAFAGVSCDTADDEPTATIADDLGEDEFALTGVVIDAKEGVQPEDGLPDADDFETDEIGGIAIRPDGPTDAEGLEGCETTQDAYVTYYTPNTDSGDLDDADAWPESLEGTTVTVEGTRVDPSEVADEAEDEVDDEVDDALDASPDATDDADTDDDADGCLLVLDRIEQSTAAPTTGDDDDATGQTGDGTGDGDASPGASGSPEVTADGTPDFPDHENTDPIFEGTPSPDPCEGAKACEEHRESGQQPQP